MSPALPRKRRLSGRVDAAATLLARVLPRSLGDRVDQAGRDVGMVLRSLRGEHPSPLVARRPRAPGTAVQTAKPTALAPRPLRVTRVVRETPDAVSLYLEDPSGKAIDFIPGQFLTVVVEVGGQSLRRAYSLASPALADAPPHITVKRMHEGRVSGFVHRQVEAGDTLHVFGPSGEFTVAPDPSAERHLVMLAGGSGITPVMSIAHTTLAREPGSRVTLIYGNRGPGDIIFRQRLDDLATEHPGRLHVDHVLSEPPEGWAGASGLLDQAHVAERLDALEVQDGPAVEYFVCGPTPMMEAVHAVLADRGVPRSRVREERYVRPEERKTGRHASATPQPITVRVGGLERSLIAQPGQTLLESGLAAGVDMPFSCAMGGCAACKVRLVEGEVDMEEPNCLGGHERTQGYVLACVSRPCGPVAIEVEP